MRRQPYRAISRIGSNLTATGVLSIILGLVVVIFPLLLGLKNTIGRRVSFDFLLLVLMVVVGLGTEVASIVNVEILDLRIDLQGYRRVVVDRAIRRLLLITVVGSLAILIVS
jgi:hypothetical protein